MTKFTGSRLHDGWGIESAEGFALGLGLIPAFFAVALFVLMGYDLFPREAEATRLCCGALSRGKAIT